MNDIDKIRRLRHALIVATSDAITFRDIFSQNIGVSDENRGQFLALVNFTLDETEEYKTGYEDLPNWRKKHIGGKV